MWWFLWGCSVSNQTPKSNDENAIEEAVPEEEILVEDQRINEAPQIKYFRFSKEKYITGDTVAVEFKGQDPEGRPIQSEILWEINDEKLLLEKNVQLHRLKATKGDVIRCRLILSDGEKQSQKMIVTRVENSSPVWKNDPRDFKELNGHVVEAEDPDGDELKYIIEGAPKGMTISSKGKIEYRPSIYEPGGAYSISVIAEDPDGALVRWDFSITVPAGKR